MNYGGEKGCDFQMTELIYILPPCVEFSGCVIMPDA